MSAIEAISDTSKDPAVQGFLHRPEAYAGRSLTLTHGAGGNAQSGLLMTFAETFAAAGFAVLRCNLPFRQVRRFGPPRPGDAERDRQGIENAVALMKRSFPGGTFFGGQSYGGRQASMLCAEKKIADGLLLFSYPLHAPGHPERPRTQHLSAIRIPVMFVHGSRDPFGSIDEIEAARELVPAKTLLLPVEGAGHDLGFKGKTSRADLPVMVLRTFQQLFK
jgi:uncharacterized protein